MFTITSTEFKQHFGKYNLLAQKEEINITSYGKVIYTLVPKSKNKVRVAESLIGVLPKDVSFGEDLNERE